MLYCRQWRDISRGSCRSLDQHYTRSFTVSLLRDNPFRTVLEVRPQTPSTILVIHVLIVECTSSQRLVLVPAVDEKSLLDRRSEKPDNAYLAAALYSPRTRTACATTSYHFPHAPIDTTCAPRPPVRSSGLVERLKLVSWARTHRA